LRCSPTCSDRASANSAASGLQSYDETAWRIQPAPHSDEIIWGNLSMRYKQRVMRSLGMWVLFIAILVFYLPITAAIQMVVNLQNASAIPGLNVIVRLPFVTQVLQGILPGEIYQIECWCGLCLRVRSNFTSCCKLGACCFDLRLGPTSKGSG
jgi:hypothetical protein